MNVVIVVDNRRDYNSTLNILKLGSEGTLVENGPLLVKNKQVTSMKHEAPIF